MAEYKKTGTREEADRGRLPGGALSRRHSERHARSGRDRRNQRAGTYRGALRRMATVEPATAPYLYHDLTPRVLATPRHYAYIKIAEGCDHPCSFCVIPAIPREVPQPPIRIRGGRSHAPVRAGRPRDQSDRPGHHLLRRRSRTEGRPGPSAGAAGPDRNAAAEVGSLPVLLSEQGHAEAAGYDRRTRLRWSSTSTCRCSMPAPPCSSA